MRNKRKWDRKYLAFAYAQGRFQRKVLPISHSLGASAGSWSQDQHWPEEWLPERQPRSGHNFIVMALRLFLFLFFPIPGSTNIKRNKRLSGNKGKRKRKRKGARRNFFFLGPEFLNKTNKNELCAGPRKEKLYGERLSLTFSIFWLQSNPAQALLWSLLWPEKENCETVSTCLWLIIWWEVNWTQFVASHQEIATGFFFLFYISHRLATIKEEERQSGEIKRKKNAQDTGPKENQRPLSCSLFWGQLILSMKGVAVAWPILRKER